MAVIHEKEIALLTYYLKGLGLGAGLIVAIGSQNAHVLRMGLQRQHVALTVLVCIVCETLLIAAGVAGVGAAIERQPLLVDLARWGGASFLAWYGLRAWRSAFAPQALQARASAQLNLRQALLTVLAVTLLNPHVYLDTVLLLGTVGAQQGPQQKWWFAAGAMSAALVWFTLLGFGARLLSHWFVKPAAWRMLDGVIGAVMLLLAATLILQPG
ncbi:LysE/ArgO family amino acid transporter [Noviherbaspirillum saxi]|uniref:Amino acid transporter n=1 Tax=Noviherbaspirillum saxi TaxID=2320863 RepID=A0A3A3G5I4_9BURK|nr:LysE family transporter [Noviherbaspirillum saxi]RJF97385.1 amino acid transporter [Noviherbaspirillum saxi]